jgi:hypothetical protein
MAKKKTKKKDPRRGRISGSRLDRLALCPGSNFAEMGKTEESNPLADAGTRIHAALEAGNVDSLDDENEIKVAVKAAELREDLVERFLDDDGPFDSFSEVRLWGLDEQISGQIDFGIQKESRALILDYKTGYLESVDAEQNMQLKCYAVLVKEKYPHLEEITVAIIQPRVWPEVSKAVYNLKDLQMARRYIAAIILKSNDAKAARHPGPTQCKYCKAKADCPEAIALTTSLTKYENLELPSEKLPELLDACGTAKKIIAAIEARAKSILELDPAAVAGWTLKTGATMTKVASPQKLFSRMNERHSVLPHEFVDVCDVGKGKLKALLKTVSGLKGKALDEELKSLLDGITKETEKAPSLAKDKGS